MYNPNYQQQHQHQMLQQQQQQQQQQRQPQYHALYHQQQQQQQLQQQQHQQQQQQQQRPQLQQLQNMQNYGPVRYTAAPPNVSVSNVPNQMPTMQSRPLVSYFRQNEMPAATANVARSNLYFTGRDKQTMESAERVKIKSLPFYEVKQELIKQKLLVPTRTIHSDAKSLPRVETQLDFGLTIQQCSLIAASREIVKSTNRPDYGYQLQLRFALLNLLEEQEDGFPPSLIVKVNGKQIQLPALIPSNYPGTPARQPSKPLNITTQAKLRPMGFTPANNHSNSILISWMQDTTGKDWVVSLNLVKKLSATDLFEKTKLKGNLEPTVTKKMIHTIMKADGDDIDMALTSLTVSVGCPIGKSRMIYPCRATTCSHIQCFDAVLYLQMNEKKPVWSCPVCNKKILYETLSIDGFFVNVVKDLPSSSGNDIEIMPDGAWKPIEQKAEDNHSSQQDVKVTPKPGGVAAGAPAGSTLQSEIETISIDDDSDSETGSASNSTKTAQIIKNALAKLPPPPTPQQAPNGPTEAQKEKTTPVLISLDDSDDEDTPNSNNNNPTENSVDASSNSNPKATNLSASTTSVIQDIPPTVTASTSTATATPVPGPSYPATRWGTTSAAIQPPRPPSGSGNVTAGFNGDDDDDVICLSD